MLSLFAHVMGRSPSSSEREASVRFVSDARAAGGGSEQAWTLWVQVLFGTIDFRYQ